MTKPMLGLTLKNPWALFVARLLKLNETRGWNTPYRGMVAIHAGKNKECIPDTGLMITAAGIKKSIFDPDPDWVPQEDEDPRWNFGKVVAVATIAGCVPTESVVKAISKQEEAFGDYSPGRYAFVMTGTVALPDPVPCRGLQGLWPVPEEVRAKVLAQLPSECGTLSHS